MNIMENEILITLASSLGVSTEHLWGVMIKQARIDSIINVLVATSSIIFWVLSWNALYRNTFVTDHDEYPHWSDSETPRGFARAIFEAHKNA